MASDPSPPTTRRARRRPWLMIVGGLLVLLAVAAAVTGGVLSTMEASDLESLPRQTEPHVVDLDSGETVHVFSESPHARCTVTGPGGETSNDGEEATAVALGSGELYDVMTIDADAAGEYTVDCTAGFVVESQGDAWVLYPTGCALGCLGVVLFVLGLVLWLVRRGHERRLDQTGHAPPPAS